jgi:hypothetical protein
MCELMKKKLHDIKRLLTVMALIAVVAFSATAQVDAAFSHFWTGQSYYNPAAAGEINAIHIVLGSRMQWVDIKHAPMSFYLTGNMPQKLLEQRWGVGVKASLTRMFPPSSTMMILAYVTPQLKIQPLSSRSGSNRRVQ